MTLVDALGLPPRGALSIVGGGGKSTLLLRLARDLAAEGRWVAVATTTHITRKQGTAAGFLLTVPDVEALRAALAAHGVVCIATLCTEVDKLAPPTQAVLFAAAELTDFLLVEADGARRLPVKAPADHEPVLLPHSDLVVAVAGLSALGRPLDQICHRFELASNLLGVPIKTPLTPRLLAQLLAHEQGQFKGVGAPERFRVVLNQADDDTNLALAGQTAAALKALLPGCRVIAAALREEDCVKEVFEPC